MQEELDDLVKGSQKDGLKINISKTRNLRVNTNTTGLLFFKIAEKATETVDDFTYVGFKIAADGGGLLDVEQRKNKTRGAFAKLKSIWRSNISLHLKMYSYIS
jgi:hypothetical protein